MSWNEDTKEKCPVCGSYNIKETLNGVKCNNGMCPISSFFTKVSNEINKS